MQDCFDSITETYGIRLSCLLPYDSVMDYSLVHPGKVYKNWLCSGVYCIHVSIYGCVLLSIY